MEKTFKLDEKEQRMALDMEQANLPLNAQWAQLRRQQDDVEKRLTAAEEKNKSFLMDALAVRGVQQVEMAQIINGQLVCRVPDEEIPALAAAPSQSDKHVNGAPQIAD